MVKIVDANTKMSIIVFSRKNYTLTNLTSCQRLLRSKLDAEKDRFPDSSTETAAALRAAQSELVNQGRHDAKKIIIVITDGVPDSVPKTDLAVKDAKAGGT